MTYNHKSEILVVHAAFYIQILIMSAHLLQFFFRISGEEPVTFNGRVYSYLFADTQEPNEDDEDRDLPIVDRLLLGGELCDPYTGQNDTMYV